VATIVVLACYVLGVISLNLLVARRLTEQADARIAARLVVATKEGPGSLTSAVSDRGDADADDAPIFLWMSRDSDVPRTVTPGSPRLPRLAWTDRPITVNVGGTPLRIDAVRFGSGWLIAGESIAQLDRVGSALMAPEIVFGAVLVLVVYGGSLIVGLRASAPLEVVQRRQAEFTADASHELRTPLSVIEAEVELSLSRPRSPDEYRAVLERISGESDRLRRIVDELLWLARADDEGASAHREQSTDVAAAAQICGERFQPIATGRKVALSVEIEKADHCWIAANPSWIDRLLGVLVDNACKYAGAGGAVRINVRGGGSRVFLQVDDSGPGIPMGQQSSVFDRFHRGTDTGSGVGLGLAIADSVVRASEGTWSVGSSPFGGARMEVSWKRHSGRTGINSQSGAKALEVPTDASQSSSPGNDLQHSLGIAVPPG
jgi:signal transduction histidine kinase